MSLRQSTASAASAVDWSSLLTRTVYQYNRYISTIENASATSSSRLNRTSVPNRTPSIEFHNRLSPSSTITAPTNNAVSGSIRWWPWGWVGSASS
jgi:hypothetical protein